MSLYKQYETNPNLERDGVELFLGVNEDGSEVKIRLARAGGANTRFNRVLEQEMQPYKRLRDSGNLTEDISRKVLAIVYAKTVVLGWSNVQDKDGKPLEFTQENVIKLFNDLPDLFTDVLTFAREASLFKDIEREADAKNSQRS